MTKLAQKTVNRDPIEGSTQFAQSFVTALTAPPLVGCVVWSLQLSCALIFSDTSGWDWLCVKTVFPHGIWCNAALRMMVRNIFSFVFSSYEVVSCAAYPLSLYCIGPSFPSSC